MNRRDLLKAIAGAAAATFLGGLQLMGRRRGTYKIGVDYGTEAHGAYTLMEHQDDGRWHVVETWVGTAP